MADRGPGNVVKLHPNPPEGLEEQDDAALMLLVAADHRGAFEALASRYLARLASFCGKFLGSRTAGDDVAQAVLLEVWQQRAHRKPRAQVRTYLFTLARSRCLNHSRGEGRRASAHDRAGVLAAARDAATEIPGQLAALLERERQRRVREALLELPEKLREAVLLRIDQQLDYSEMAQILKTRESTLRSRVFHALARLREGLAEEDA